ncbi:unnamed protein product [Alternaria alternata]
MSSQINPDAITNWIVVEQKDARSLSRHGPYSNSQSKRNHEADVFHGQLKNHYLTNARANFGAGTSFGPAGAIKDAFKALLETGDKQRIKLWQDGAVILEDWGWIKVERGYQPETADAMDKLIAGENPDSQGPPEIPLGKNLHLYTVSRRKWNRSLWDLFLTRWTEKKHNHKPCLVPIETRRKDPKMHWDFCEELPPTANVDAIGNVETFKHPQRAIAYAKGFTGNREFFPEVENIVKDLGYAEVPFVCTYPNSEPDANEFPWIVLVIHHSLISRGERVDLVAI